MSAEPRCLQPAQPVRKPWAPEAEAGSPRLVSSILLMPRKGLTSSNKPRIKLPGVSLLDLMPGTNLANYRLRRPLQRSVKGAEPRSPGAAGWQREGFAQLCSLHSQWKGRKNTGLPLHGLSKPQPSSRAPICGWGER